MLESGMFKQEFCFLKSTIYQPFSQMESLLDRSLGLASIVANLFSLWKKGKNF
jgi:hypothetical protein